MLGLFSRFALLFLIITFAVAVFHAHAGDELMKRAHAILYLAVFVVLFFTGPGKYSADRDRKSVV